MVGLDVTAHVVSNFSQSRAGEALRLPPFVGTMLERRWLGDKTGQGFYKKEKDADGNELRLALDWQTVAYRPATRPKFPSLELAKNAESLPERLRMLMAADPRKDKAAAFQWQLLSRLFAYAAGCLPEIAEDPASIDRAMRTGFNWKLGPFEMWDAVGVELPPPACGRPGRFPMQRSCFAPAAPAGIAASLRARWSLIRGGGSMCPSCSRPASPPSPTFANREASSKAILEPRW